MDQLAACVVSRGGRTARMWNEETDEVELDTENDGLFLRFSLSSKGGGITDVKIKIGPADFAALISAMASVDRGCAIREMAARLASELAKQPEYDKVTVREARSSVVAAADRAYREAPSGRDHAERLTRDMVQQLVDQLNEADDSDSD